MHLHTSDMLLNSRNMPMWVLTGGNDFHVLMVHQTRPKLGWGVKGSIANVG